MKILHVINNLGSGGAEKLLEELVPLMNQESDQEADVLLLTDEGNVFCDSLIQKGVKIDIIGLKRIYDPRNIIQIRRYIVTGEYDIVHSHLFPTQYWVALSRLFIKNRNIKFITTEHSTHNRRREKKYFRYIDKFIYDKYDVVISISEKTKKNLLDWIDPKRKDIAKHVVIENGVNIGEIREASPYKKDELVDGINEETKLVCMVGRFSEAKDQPTLIKAISKLPSDIHLVLVGEGPLLDENKKLVNNLQILDRIHFLGFRQDIPRILKTVDIVALSSHWEGFGLAAVEGMAAGKPVIASNVEGLNDVVEDKWLKFQAKNENDLANKIIELLSSNELYHSKVNYVQKRCMDFDIKQKAIEIENLYKYWG